MKKQPLSFPHICTRVKGLGCLVSLVTSEEGEKEKVRKGKEWEETKTEVLASLCPWSELVPRPPPALMPEPMDPKVSVHMSDLQSPIYFKSCLGDLENLM